MKQICNRLQLACDTKCTTKRLYEICDVGFGIAFWKNRAYHIKYKVIVCWQHVREITNPVYTLALFIA